MLDQFAPAFFHPTYQRFLVLMVAATLTTGRRTVANLLRTLGHLHHGDPSTYQHVLSMRHWSTMDLARILIRFILKHFVGDGPVMLAGDDTVDEHRGAKVYGKGCHRDPVRSTHSHTAFRWGHKWVVLAILVRFPFASRPWALPVLVALYRPEAKPKANTSRSKKKPKDKSKAKAKRRAKRRAEIARDASGRPLRRHKTPPELLRQLLAVLVHWFPDRQFIIAADGGYATHALARFAHRHQDHLTLVSLFYKDANLYEPPPEVAAKTTGRPRKKGKKLPSPEVVVAEASRERLAVSWYGGGHREVEAVRGTAHWYKGGEGLVPVTWVYVHDRTGTHRDTYLFSTNEKMETGTIISTYTGRWSIETTFEECRAYLGLETTRGRVERTVLRAAPCLFGLYSVVSLLYASIPGREALGPAVTYRGKVGITFSDAITVVRRELWREGVFEAHGQSGVFQKLPEPIQSLLMTMLAPAA
ncbi:MAG: transposase [Acidobacteriaceae bacterium]|nr:transposase [Acidobacteriaceae bacterium]